MALWCFVQNLNIAIIRNIQKLEITNVKLKNKLIYPFRIRANLALDLYWFTETFSFSQETSM